MKILITGGAGAIGVHLISYLVTHSNWDIVIIDSFQEKYSWKRLVHLMRENPTWFSRLTSFQHDLTLPIPAKIKGKLSDVRGMIHLAAMADMPVSIRNPVEVIKNNIDSTVTMLELARQLEVEYFLYFSTDQVYGPVKRGKTHAEWDPHRPSSPYAASKAASEDIGYAYWRSYKVPLIIVNSSNNFGEMQSDMKFASMVQQKLEAGEKIIIHGNKKELGTRFYIHSSNVSDALLHVISIGARHYLPGKVNDPKRYHIVGDKRLSNLDMVKVIAKIMKKKFKYQVINFHKKDSAYDLHCGLADHTLRLSGWKQPSNFISSMTASVRWQQRNYKWVKKSFKTWKNR